MGGVVTADPTGGSTPLGWCTPGVVTVGLTVFAFPYELLEEAVEVELPPPGYISGSMPEMMKNKASTAASVLTTLIERRSIDICVCCL